MLWGLVPTVLYMENFSIILTYIAGKSSGYHYD